MMSSSREPAWTPSGCVPPTRPGAPVITIDTLTVRAVPEGIGRRAPVASRDNVSELAWSPVPHDTSDASARPLPEWAVVSPDPAAAGGAAGRRPIHPGLASLASCPELVIWPLPLPETVDGEVDPLPRLHRLTRRTLSGLQDWLAHPEAAASRLVILTPSLRGEYLRGRSGAGFVSARRRGR